MVLASVFAYLNERRLIMYEYSIGIIDEDIADIQFIERTILINKPDSISEENISFWRYPLPTDTSEVYQSVAKSVIEKIEENEIQALIIDYKIIISSIFLEGTEIFKILSEIVPKFPIIMLSNLEDDCYKKEFVDADKVYSKRNFFKIEEDYSKEKVFNIFRNIDNYINQRTRWSSKLLEHLHTLGEKGYSEELLQSIIEAENILDDFCPQKQSSIEKSLEIRSLKNAVDLLEKANDLVGGTDED